MIYIGIDTSQFCGCRTSNKKLKSSDHGLKKINNCVQPLFRYLSKSSRIFSTWYNLAIIYSSSPKETKM